MSVPPPEGYSRKPFQTPPLESSSRQPSEKDVRSSRAALEVIRKSSPHLKRKIEWNESAEPTEKKEFEGDIEEEVPPLSLFSPQYQFPDNADEVQLPLPEPAVSLLQFSTSCSSSSTEHMPHTSLPIPRSLVVKNRTRERNRPAAPPLMTSGHSLFPEKTSAPPPSHLFLRGSDLPAASADEDFSFLRLQPNLAPGLQSQSSSESSAHLSDLSHSPDQPLPQFRRAPLLLPKKPPNAPKPKQFGLLDSNFHNWTDEQLASYSGSAFDSILAARSRRFKDRQGKEWSVSPSVACGTYLSVHDIDGDPKRLFKRFSDTRIMENGKHLGSFARSKDRQYERLVKAGVSVVHTSPVKGGWRQTKLPFLLEDLITWDANTRVGLDENTGLLTGLTPVASKALKQVKDILLAAWKHRIDIDPLPGNFGYSLNDEGDPIVALFDFREESDDGFAEHPLEAYLDGDFQCLAKFSRGNQEVRSYLDPRQTTFASMPAT